MSQKTALILLNYNDAPSLLSALERGLLLEGIDLCVAVDNGSADNSLKQVLAAAEKKKPAAPEGKASENDGAAKHNTGDPAGKKTGELFYDGRLCIIETGRNGGYGFGNNAGVKAAAEKGCSLALIANPDVTFGENTVKALKEAVLGDKNVLAAGAVMEGVSPEECAWPLKDFRSELYAGGPVSRRLFKKNIYYAPSYFRELKEPVPVGAVHGSLVMVRTKEFLELGGFDEEMFLFGEERVLGRKIAAAGGKVLLVPETYRHAGSGTMKKIGLNAVQREKERLKSEAYYYEKYLGAGAKDMKFAKMFQNVVLFETKLAARLGLL